MKLISATLAGVLLSVSLAAAADLPVRNYPIRQTLLPVFTWTGFYAGAQIGAAWQRDRLTETDTCGLCIPDVAHGHGAGVLGGLHAGANWQTGALVVGLEGDMELANLRLRTVYPSSAPDAFSSHIGWQGSFRGRLGYAIDRLLIYATGGLAFADIRHSYDRFDLVPGPNALYTLGASESMSRVRTGWTLGGGLEYAFTNAWSANIEYRYTDFGRRTDVPAIFSVFNTFSEHHRETQQAVRTAVSYRF
jgi:outer membrane immunogenic protein